MGCGLGGLEDLAATYSPATWVAVPWALGVFTAEFGMGSGAGPPPKPPGRPAHPVGVSGWEWFWWWVCLRACRGAGHAGVWLAAVRDGGSRACRAIRTGQLRALPHFHTRPIDVLVLHGPRGDLVLRRVSRLDAFSGYPVRT